jgi:hypothetical protein
MFASLQPVDRLDSARLICIHTGAQEAHRSAARELANEATTKIPPIGRDGYGHGDIVLRRAGGDAS